MANALVKVRKFLVENANKEITFSEIRIKCSDLINSEISMALCHLTKQRYLTRSRVDSRFNHGRHTVWQYRYHVKRLPEAEWRVANYIEDVLS
jgi:hypothetical protein